MTKTKTVISAKISPELVAEIDHVSGLLGITTRNEFIERAVRLYVGAFRSVEQQIVPKGAEGLDD